MPIDQIEVGTRLRKLDRKTVESLAEAIGKEGMLHPLVVTVATSYEYENKVRLVAGHHRLEAAKKLGWECVPITIVDFDAIEAEMAELSENLIRAELDVAERAQHVTRLKQLHAQQRAAKAEADPAKLAQPEPVCGGRGKKGFAAELAAKTGRSKAAINKDLARGERIVSDVLEAVKERPALNNGAAMDKLMALRPEHQREVVDGTRQLDPETAPEPDAAAEPAMCPALQDAAQEPTVMAHEAIEMAVEETASPPIAAGTSFTRLTIDAEVEFVMSAWRKVSPNAKKRLWDLLWRK